LVGRPENPPRVFENKELRFVYHPSFISMGSLGCQKNGLILDWGSTP
jgi:hypothetical protein